MRKGAGVFDCGATKDRPRPIPGLPRVIPLFVETLLRSSRRQRSKHSCYGEEGSDGPVFPRWKHAWKHAW